MPRLTIYFYLFAGMAIFGSGTPVSALVTGTFPVFIGSGLRMAVAAAILLPLILIQEDERKSISSFARKDWLVVGAVALVGMFGFSVFMLYGMRLVSGVVGSIVMSTTPAVTALASFVFLKDHLGWRKAAGIGLAVAGVLLLNLGGEAGTAAFGADLLLGSLLVFAAVCSEASYTLLGKVATKHMTPLVLAGLASSLAALLFLPFALYQWQDFSPVEVPGSAWLAVLWWGAGTLALGSVLWYRGVRRVPGSTAAGFMGVMPVSALLLSYALLGEPFVWLHLVGFSIVFAGVLLIAWSHTRMSRDAS